MTSQGSTVDEGLYDKAKRFIIGQVNPKLTKFRHPLSLALVIGIQVVVFTCLMAYFFSKRCKTLGGLLPMAKLSDQYRCEPVQVHWDNRDKSFAGGWGYGLDKDFTYFEALNGTFDEDSFDVGFDCDVLQPTRDVLNDPYLKEDGHAYGLFQCEGCACVESSGLECGEDAQGMFQCCKPGEPQCFACDNKLTGGRDDCNGPSTAGGLDDACLLAGFAREDLDYDNHWTYSYSLQRTVGGFDYDIRMNVAVGEFRSMAFTSDSSSKPPGWAGSVSCCKSKAGSTGGKNCMNARTDFYDNTVSRSSSTQKYYRMLSMLMSAQRNEAFPRITKDFFYKNSLYCERDVCVDPSEALGVALGYAAYVEAALTLLVLFVYGCSTGELSTESIKTIMDAAEIPEA